MAISTRTATTLDDVIGDIVSWPAGKSVYLSPDFEIHVRECLTAFLTESAVPLRMVRPEWQAFQAAIHADVLCSCGFIVIDLASLREHWQRGHFDIIDAGARNASHEAHPAFCGCPDHFVGTMNPPGVVEG